MTHPEIEKLKAKQAKELADKEREIAVRGTLPEAIRPFVHSTFTQRNGEVWVTVQRHKPYGYDPDGPKPFSLSEAVALVDTVALAAPDLATRLAKIRVSQDGCVHTRADYESPKGETKWPDAEWFRWYLRTTINDEVEFVFHAVCKDTNLRIKMDLGRWAYKLRRGEFKEWRGMRQCERTTVVPHGGSKVIKWGGGYGPSEHAQDVSVFPEDEAQLIASLEAER